MDRLQLIGLIYSRFFRRFLFIFGPTFVQRSLIMKCVSGGRRLALFMKGR